jgi:hypothetical protein
MRQRSRSRFANSRSGVFRSAATHLIAIEAVPRSAPEAAMASM